MAHYEGSYLVMSDDEINALIERCHQPEVVQRRNALFAELDQIGITMNSDGSMEVEFTPKRRPHLRSAQTWRLNVPTAAPGVELRTPNSQPSLTNWNYGPGALSAA